MNLANRYSGLILLLLVFTFFFPSTLCYASRQADFIVKNLQVTDIDNDDGTGLMISWEPLPQERRIIEYRVYRGSTPDSLFFVQKIDVNVATGVAGDVMYFYDQDYNYFLDLTAPRRLKRAKGQPRNTNLYSSYPRDLNVTGPQLKNYTILGVISEKDFYYSSKKVEVEKDGETKVYAGLNLRHVYMLKKLIPDKEYYYTVVAVNEAGRHFPPAEPAMGIPRVNSPEKPSPVHTVYLRDQERLQFEWTLPVFTDDIYFHSVYYLAKDDIAEFEEYKEQLREKEANDVARKEDDTIEEYQITMENPAQMIFRRQSANPFTSMNSGYANIENGKIIDEEHNIEVDFDTDKLNDYYFIFSLFDYSSYESFSEVRSLHETITSNDLPILPQLIVIDRENDKGDYNLIYWGKPVVFLTNSSYRNQAQTKLLVNYEFIENQAYQVRNIYFRIFDEAGNEIAYVNEFYQDRKITITIPEGTQSLSFEIRLHCNRDLPDDYVFTQKLIFNEDSRSLLPDALYMRGERVEDYNYKVYKRNITDSQFRLIRNNPGTQRELEDLIRYTNDHFVIVSEFDARQQLLLFSPEFSVTLDVERDATVRTNLFLSEVEKNLEETKFELQKYQAKKDSLIAVGAEDTTEYDPYIEHYEKQIEMVRENEILAKANSMTNHKARLKYLHRVRQEARRGFQYFMVKSDGEANFAQTPIFINADGEKFLTPTPDWFKKDRILSLLATLIFGALVWIMINRAKKGHDLFIRPIAGISEIDNAIGRATEMGRPILFVPGLDGISLPATLAGLSILGRVAKKAAEYDTRILVPCRDPIVLPIAQEIVKEAHYEAGRPDSYDKNSAFFITTAQFAFVAGVNGVMIREKTATNFYMGMFYAEALIMTETGNATGAIQISGTDAITQIPFFITTCDYTLIGEELYAASAYLAREPLMLGTLKAQDYTKFLIIVFIVVGTILSTARLTFLINAFPDK